MTPKVGPAIDIVSYESQKTAVSRPRSTGYVAFETVMNRTFSDIRNGSDAQSSPAAAQRTLERQLKGLN